MNEAIIIFVIFSFLGWVWESIYCTVRELKWANRGFLYGPVCPIYGFGGVFGYFTYNAILHGILPVLNPLAIFFVGFVLSMILEYPTSYILEKVFYARWWDYSRLPLNINGRTSVPTSVAFGIASIFVMKFIIPSAVSVLNFFPEWLINLLALFFVAIISADITLTVTALANFQKVVAEIDRSFQEHMTQRVDEIIESRKHTFSNAVKRIHSFKLPKKHINSQKIIKEKINELLRK